ncbi:MAG: hypothetical protein WKI49_07505 [Aquificaceae bacterium]
MMVRKGIYYSLFLEIAAIANLIFLKSAYQLFLLIFLHFIACFSIVNVLIHLLPERYKKDKKRIAGAFISLTLIGFFLFVVGYVLLVVAVFYLLRYQKNITEDNIKSFSLYELLADRVPPKVNLFGETPLYSIIFDNVPRSRLELIHLVMAEVKNPKLIEVVSKLISRRDEELRLSITSLYYKLENSIQERIKHLLERLESSKEDKAYLFFELSQSYYDLVYYKLVDKELEIVTLQKAEEYIYKAMNIKDAPEFYILLGKIYIAKKEYSKAIETLNKVSLYKYVNPVKYVPYIAEAYFGSGNISEVRNVIQKYSDSLRYTINPNLIYVIDFWVRKNGANSKQG